MKPKQSEVERFWTNVQQTETCWLWTGRKNRWGYGDFVITRDRKEINRRASRYAFELLRRPIPEGLELDHLCKNTSCVNPDHLEPVTHRENVMRSDNFTAINARKTHCPRGHPYDEANTYITKSGTRACRICYRGHQAAYQRRKRGLNGAQ